MDYTVTEMLISGYINNAISFGSEVIAS